MRARPAHLALTFGRDAATPEGLSVYAVEPRKREILHYGLRPPFRMTGGAEAGWVRAGNVGMYIKLLYENVGKRR